MSKALLREVVDAPAGGATYVAARGHLVMWEPCSHILVAQMVGHVTEDLAAPYIARIVTLAATSMRFEVFIDSQDVAGYDPGFRVKTTANARAHQPHTKGYTILFSSKLVAMGVAVANLALGGIIETYSDRAQFIATLDGALRERGSIGFTRRALLVDRPSSRTTRSAG
jgi:hypothetical protein